MQDSPAKLLSLVFLLDPPTRRVLLGFKKRGFGEGKWNGFGGKLEAGETLVQCAARELEEESGLAVPSAKLVSRGELTFHMLTDGMVDKRTGAVSSLLCVSVFSALLEDAQGDMVESEEMRPEWVSWDAVPLEQMWPDDSFWLPALLDGKDVVGEFTFSDKATIVKQTVTQLEPGEYATRTERAG